MKRTGYDNDNREIRIFGEKNDKLRVLKISKELCEMLNGYLEGKQTTVHLITKENGERYTTEGVQTMFKRMRDEIGLAKDISFNSARKRMSDIVFRTGGPAVEARILGHTPGVALTNYVRVGNEMDDRINERASDFTMPKTEEQKQSKVETLAKELKGLSKEDRAKLIAEMMA